MHPSHRVPTLPLDGQSSRTAHSRNPSLGSKRDENADASNSPSSPASPSPTPRLHRPNEKKNRQKTSSSLRQWLRPACSSLRCCRRSPAKQGSRRQACGPRQDDEEDGVEERPLPRVQHVQRGVQVVPVLPGGGGGGDGNARTGVARVWGARAAAHTVDGSPGAAGCAPSAPHAVTQPRDGRGVSGKRRWTYGASEAGDE